MTGVARVWGNDRARMDSRLRGNDVDRGRNDVGVAGNDVDRGRNDTELFPPKI